MSLSSGVLPCFKSHLPTHEWRFYSPAAETGLAPTPKSNLQLQLVNFMLRQLAVAGAFSSGRPRILWHGLVLLHCSPPPFDFCGVLICIFNYISNA